MVYPDEWKYAGEFAESFRMLVFVYGSLKRGYALHHLLEDQEFIGNVETAPLYRIFDLGSYPGIVEWPIGLPIRGEMYRLTDVCLGRLDEAEGVAEGLYARRDIQLALPAEWSSEKLTESVQAWFWLGSVRDRTDCGRSWPPFIA